MKYTVFAVLAAVVLIVGLGAYAAITGTAIDAISIFGYRITFILGFTNLIMLALVFLSCRCVGGSKVAERLWKHNWYKRFFNLHCYYWAVFIISVVLHGTIAVLTFGGI